MLKALVPVAADLASSIALRYACQMSESIQVEIQTIHVKAPSSESSQLGTGWVRQIWEKTMLTEAPGPGTQPGFPPPPVGSRYRRNRCSSLWPPVNSAGAHGPAARTSAPMRTCIR